MTALTKALEALERDIDALNELYKEALVDGMIELAAKLEDACARSTIAHAELKAYIEGANEEALWRAVHAHNKNGSPSKQQCCTLGDTNRCVIAARYLLKGIKDE